MTHFPLTVRIRPLWAAAIICVALTGLIAWAVLRDSGSETRSPASPPVIYFAPADVYAPNLVLFDGAASDSRPLTDLDDEILEYASSPDGSQIAFSRSNPDGTVDIWLVEITSGQMRPLTDCVKARCTAPAWHPNGTEIAYQRNDTNPATGHLEPRIWIVDVLTAQSRLLMHDLQQHGESPAWDPTGRRIAFYDETLPGIRIWETLAGSEVAIENAHDLVGRFAPDGTRFVYPVLARGLLGETFYTQLEMIDFDTMQIKRLSGGAETPVEDVFAVWLPDGVHLLVARRYLDDRYTSGTQLYSLNVESGEAEPLVVDPAYNHAAMSADSTGRWMVFQRFSLAESGAQPEIWLYDTKSGESRRIAENAFFPAFVEQGRMTRYAQIIPHPQ